MTVTAGSKVQTTVTYAQFCQGVHRAQLQGLDQGLTLAGGFVEHARRLKPGLIAAALETSDPRSAPFDIMSFLNYLKNHWNDSNRRATEF